MDSDVEMLEQKSVSALLTPGSPLALPPTESQQVSPIAPEIDDSASASPDGPSPSDIVPKSGTDSKGKGKPASAKPKSTKARAKSRPHRRLPRPRRPHYRQYGS